METVKTLWNTISNNAIGKFVFSIIACVVMIVVLLWISRRIFSRINAKKTEVDTQFIEKIIRFVIIFLALMWLIMSNDLTKSFGQTLFQSTTVIAAIAGFAAQSVLSDLLCGIIINATKPFDIGDRIELENGIAGIVDEITLRHVVLKGMDTQKYIVPNSKMNALHLKNMSYHSRIRSVDFRFCVSYTTDTVQASRIIREAVTESPYSVPGRVYAPGGEPEYGQVYFLAFRDSALELGTTVYYEPTTPTEVFKDDINTRVKQALDANGIEIPYSYLNVVVDEKHA